MTLQEELVAVMKKHLVKEDNYIKPNFLKIVNEAIWGYYEYRDVEVNRLISDRNKNQGWKGGPNR